MIELYLLLITTVLTLILWWQVIDLGKAVETFSTRFHRDAATLVELRYRQEASRRRRSAQQKTETLVDFSTLTIYKVHRDIASVPFDVLGSLRSTKKAMKIARESHDLVSDFVYGSILGVNKLAGKYARSRLDKREAGASRETDKES